MINDFLVSLLWLFGGVVGLAVFLLILSLICRVVTTSIVDSVLTCLGGKDNGEKKKKESK